MFFPWDGPAKAHTHNARNEERSMRGELRLHSPLRKSIDFMDLWSSAQSLRTLVGVSHFSSAWPGTKEKVWGKGEKNCGRKSCEEEQPQVAGNNLYPRSPLPKHKH